MVGDDSDEIVERLDQDWREACRADPIVSRGRQPPAGSPLPRLLVEAVELGDEGSKQFERAAPRSVDERLSPEEAMRQLSILGICHREQLSHHIVAMSHLVEVVARGHEAVALMFIARSDERARRDPLTGLLNRRVYEPELSRAVGAAVRGDGRTILLNFDLNGFSVVNNTLGHDRGDSFLKHAAQLISSVVRSLGGETYRIGGDEFVAVIRDGDRRVVEEALEDLKASLECPPLSYGLSLAPDEIDEASARFDSEESSALALAKLADHRMYLMKHELSDQERERRTADWLAAGAVEL
jgi:diguanylate cyclase (GGDEF)-like protein